jgi:hypothetical protein
MANVKSTWASTPITLSGTFAPEEWTGAGAMPMPGGIVLVKNDAQFLYLAVDLVNDTGNTPGVGDYFWLSFDVDRDANITPRYDVDYGIYPSLPIRMARSYYLGPGTWTGILGDPSPSEVQQGFAPSPNSATPHRIWEMRIALSEIGVGGLGQMTLPFVRFGLRVASTSPGFVTDFPPDFHRNFAALQQIYLATGPDTPYPSNLAGPVIGGVGLIPASAIVEGRATTLPPYTPAVTNAAFGGTLNLIFNRPSIQALWNAGVRKYRVLHRYLGKDLSVLAGAAPAFERLRRGWTNYRWNGATYVLDSFGPDDNDYYELRDPLIDYATKDLLFQWATIGSAGYAPAPTGFHEFQVEFRNAAGQVVPTPSQTLQVYVDNALPELQIYEIKYGNQVVTPCSIIEIEETAVPVKVRFRAYDPEGNLRSFALQAYYGGPNAVAVNVLPAGMGQYPGGHWQGVADQSIDCPVIPKFPPVTCAYQFRLSSHSRVTNGYGYISTYKEVTTQVTFHRPGAPAYSPPRLAIPFGFKSEPNGLYVVGTDQ